MSFDNSRYNFDHWKLYAGVVSEQGRVQSDSDWNEWLAGLTRRIDAGSFDTFGHAVYPQTTPNAFEIDASSSSGNIIRIGFGRMYVDGILVENLGASKNATWDSALAETSNTPQPQPSTPQPLTDQNSITYVNQPFNNGQTVPTTSGAFMAYLDVWRRPITYIEDSSLIDSAINVDTTGRLQTAWRVNLLPLPVVTIPQKSLTNTFADGDLVTQDNSKATGIVIGGLSGSGPLLLSQLTGTANATDNWTNTGGAKFTPSGLPVIQDSYIAGAVASGSASFTDGEQLVQYGTGATATLVSIASDGPMVVNSVSGSPSPLASWVGQSSDGVFQPASLPSALLNSIAGSTTGTFVPGEEVIQKNTNASAIVIGPVPQAGPMNVGLITGTPSATDEWKGQTSGAVFKPTAMPAPSSWTCGISDYSIPWPVSSGLLNTQPVSTPKTGPCCMTAGVGYTGAENQLYRIEIHTPGGPGGAGATFKWSRENASVQTAVTAIGMAATSAGPNGAQLTVQSLGRDQVLGFQNGNWIEITDEWHDNAGLPGELYKIDHVDIPTSSIILTTQLSANFSSATLSNNAYTRIIRWDQAGWVYNVESGNQQQYVDLDGTLASGALKGTLGIPIPSDGSPVVLENGVAVTFSLSLSNGSFQPMDFWNFTARASDGTISQPISPAPQGIAHHFTNLGIVTFSTSSSGAKDCRTAWPPTSGGNDCGCCCTVTVGDGKTSFGKFTSIQKAIESLTHGGDVSILCGDFYENILIQDKANITIHGCGQKTRVFSSSLQKGGGTTTDTGSTAIDVPAVFSIARSANISISSLTIEAATDSIGVLLDHPAGSGTGKLIARAASNKLVKLSELEFKSQGMPAITAIAADSLFIRENSIRMPESGKLYPAVYLSGEHLWFERNTVEIASLRVLRVVEALKSEIGKAESSSAGKDSQTGAAGSGGVQVGGPSRDVWIVENQITGGLRNGITLGNLITLDASGNDTGEYLGLILKEDELCSGGGSGGIPPTGGSGNNPTAAGGKIRELHILRNRIADTGMCGIGPIGFFDLKKVTEVISLEDVLIAENLVLNTLIRNVLRVDAAASPYGYGAISLPDVINLTVRDNIVSNYGVRPGAEVCGIYVYHGQVVEISRNQIRESRDLNGSRGAEWSSYGGRRAGIYIENVTPPQLDTSPGSLWLKAYELDTGESSSKSSNSNYSLYVSGIPALRIVDNTVRVAFGLALYVSGVGPFSILGNNFATGGAVTYNSDLGEIDRAEYFTGAEFSESITFTPLTVMIFDRGCSIELGDVFYFLLNKYSSLFESADSSVASMLTGMEEALTNSNGTVLFANNICQLTADVSRVRGGVSVVVLSLDHINFTGNELWINGGRGTALLDAALAGITLQTTSNRFQEALGSVKYSGLSFGVANTTANNIATYCFFAFPLFLKWWQYIGNTILIPALCKKRKVAEAASGSQQGG
jgi:Family of unknown function (DUF6519)